MITGASAGIGEALARHIAVHCEHLVLVARRRELLEQLKEKVGDRAAVHLVVADVADHQPFQSALRQALTDLPAVDLLVMNAGISRHGEAGKHLQLPLFQSIYAVNLFGAIAAVDVVLPEMMAANRGHIVGVSSIAGYRGLPGAAAYCSSKSALWRALESLRCELADTALTISTIHPGFVETELTAKNKFKMPFLMDCDTAAAHMTRVILKRKIHDAFPWQYRWLYKLLRPMPDAMFYRIFKIVKR